jgi:hypothetical protein
MNDHRGPAGNDNEYPHGRGYGHDYMRGGEVFGGYGYSEREEYERNRGELGLTGEHPTPDGSMSRARSDESANDRGS